ncbi:MAG: hypothetical protein EOO59_10390 [Hymenobacter sp.]|nr:MAG: hypothetical protein EOO59_10390 [Hymenobacter sp.]
MPQAAFQGAAGGRGVQRQARRQQPRQARVGGGAAVQPSSSAAPAPAPASARSCGKVTRPVCSTRCG